jgi:hypothetical protein
MISTKSYSAPSPPLPFPSLPHSDESCESEGSTLIHRRNVEAATSRRGTDTGRDGGVWAPGSAPSPHRQYPRLGEDRVAGASSEWAEGDLRFAIRAARVPSEHRWCHHAIGMSIFHIFLRQGAFAKHAVQIFAVATARTPVPLRPQHRRAIAVPALTDDRRGLGRPLRDPVSRVPQTSVIKRRHTTRVERCHAFSPRRARRN